MRNTSRLLLLAPVALAMVIALAGCTGGGDEAVAVDPSASAGIAKTDGGQAADKAGTSTAGTTTAVLSEQTFDATAREPEDAPGGKVTTTLRALEVSGETMTLRWAFRWDNPDAADDATTSLYDLSVENLPTLTDGINLKQYRPLCTSGSWSAGIASWVQCGQSALVSPSNEVFFTFPNHSTVEAWAVFAAPQDDDAIFDALVIDGWPSFSAVAPTEAA